MNQTGGPKDFAHLITEEDAQIQNGEERNGNEKEVAFDRVIGQPGSAEEPWVAFTNRDRVGLALSGGGIRSATFNLGLLQSLRHKGILNLIDYLSTVSGGGYVGGFWTVWRQRSSEVDEQDGQPLIFPKQTQRDTADGKNDPALPSPKEIRERPEIRHMREFSRFLMPRVGFMDAEMWNGVVAILFGLIPSLIVTLAVVGLGLTCWLFLNALMLNSGWLLGAVVMFVMSLGLHLIVERQFWKRQGAEEAEYRSWMWFVVAVLLSIVSALAMGAISYILVELKSSPEIGPMIKEWVFGPEPINPKWAVFGPAGAWLFTAGMLVTARLLSNRQSHDWHWFGAYLALALDRGIARCLAPAVVWSTLGGLWLLGIWLLTNTENNWWHQIGTSGGTAAIFAALFAWLRDWLVKPAQPSNLQTVLIRLKPVLPQILAYVAVAALFVMVSQVLLLFAFDAHNNANHFGWPRLIAFASACVVIIAVALWLFDPANIGLHEFYRSRIARCFLGAANPEAIKRAANHNRQTNERQQDDMRLGEIPQPAAGDPVPRPGALYRPMRLRPIHLICCAANNLAGDPLGSLYRGARSAVLSQWGISLGDESASLPDLRLSSALTASAAAFNSNMGGISMHLGLPVTFLMTALNLRLGLWVPHPCNPRRTQRRFPGIFFFREMFGRTRSVLPASSKPKETHGSWYLHLSDGAHFENLGLYELIRRHCRYIIVSDCGADPEYSFDDLANAIRRVREDFGVEIELDLEPIRPGKEGLARQHVVAGVIHYDGVTGCDKGTLLYFKPVLTGNEPCDLLQYKTRNSVFPQESTGDQFYDEAQWESYHRLGEHSGHECFRFVENLPEKKARTAESIFHFANKQWQSGWPGQNDEFLALTSKFTQFESEMRDHAPAFLRSEFFPEVAISLGAPAEPTAEDQVRAVYFVMLAIQLMEDAWLTCKLETHWAHPLNEGWMSYLHRWASTPSFHRWWPILKPIYSSGFRNFAKRQFKLQFNDIIKEEGKAEDTSIDTRLQLQLVPASEAREGFAWKEWQRRQPPTVSKSSKVLTYELFFPTPSGSKPLPSLQIGVAVIEVDSATGVASWTTNHFYVPPTLDGAGFIGRFLDAVLKHFDSEASIKDLRVTILDPDRSANDPRPRPDPASRDRRRHLVDFYKSRGFNYDRKASGQSHEFNQLCRKLRQ